MKVHFFHKIGLIIWVNYVHNNQITKLAKSSLIISHHVTPNCTNITHTRYRICHYLLFKLSSKTKLCQAINSSSQVRQEEHDKPRLNLCVQSNLAESKHLLNESDLKALRNSERHLRLNQEVGEFTCNESFSKKQRMKDIF